MFCTNCGMGLSDNTRFCTECGQPTGVDMVQPVGVNMSSETKEVKKDNNTSGKLISLIGTFFGILIGGYIGFLTRPSMFDEKLPFKYCITAGANINPEDKDILRNLAVESFMHIIFGAIIVGLLALILLNAKRLFSRKKDN